MRYQKPKQIFGLRGTSLRSFNSPVSYQRGEGFGSFIKSLFKGLSPVAKRLAINTKNAVGSALKSDIAKQAGQELLHQGLNTSANIIGDILDGQNVKESVKNNLNTAKQNVKTTLKTALKSGIKRKIDNINAIHPEVKKRKTVKRKNIIFAPKNRKNQKGRYSLFEDDDIQRR